jgi:hypothetical protein
VNVHVYTGFGPTNSHREGWELVPGPHKMDGVYMSKMSITLPTSTKCKDSRGESISRYLVHTLFKLTSLVRHEYTIIIKLKEYPQFQTNNTVNTYEDGYFFKSV